MAVETRCDLDQVETGMGIEADRDTILEMGQEQADNWIRTNVVSFPAQNLWLWVPINVNRRGGGGEGRSF